MPLLNNANPLGQVDVPLLGRSGEPIGETGSGCLEPGEQFECSPEHARILLAQAGNYLPADPAAQAIADQLAADLAAASQPTEPATEIPPDPAAQPATDGADSGVQ